MPLPKPSPRIYTTKIPSTGATVKFRPFNVKEEKFLILAQESEDIATITNAIQDILESCIQDNISVKDLAIFDVEFLMTQIRAKSVGEVVNLLMPCAENPNHEKIPVRIDLTKIEVDFPEQHKKVIPLYDDVGVAMKYPTLDMLETMEKADSFEIAMLCTDYIYDAEQMYPAKEQTKEELKEFFETLEQSQFSKVEEFFQTMPVYQHILEYTCMNPECRHVHKRLIKGISNFFV